MTLKNMFEKVEAYNEVAEMMGSRKAKISLYDCGIYQGTSFETYKDLCKYVKKEYLKEVSDGILKSDSWKFDGELTIEWVDYFGNNSVKFSAELVSA